MSKARNYILQPTLGFRQLHNCGPNLNFRGSILHSCQAFWRAMQLPGLVPQAYEGEQKLDIRVPSPMNLDGMENLETDRELNWVCSVPSQGKITLTLHWEGCICLAELFGTAYSPSRIIEI